MLRESSRQGSSGAGRSGRAVGPGDGDGRIIDRNDLFGPTPQVADRGRGAAGRPGLPIRLSATLLYLKHAFHSNGSPCSSAMRVEQDEAQYR